MNEIRVISGLHRGVSLPLDGESIVIGASLEADIVLADPGIADQHIKVESSERLPPNCWKLSVIDAETWDSRGNPVTGSITAKINTTINIGGVWISFADESSSWPSGDISFIGQNKSVENKFNKSLIAKVFCIAVAVITGILTLTGNNSDGTSSIAAVYNPGALTGMVGVTLAADSAPKSAPPTAVEQKNLRQPADLDVFRKMLKERELNNVDISVNDNSWELTGILEKNENDVLRRMIRRFKVRYDNSVKIENNTEIASDRLPFDIVRVMSGPYGHVEVKGGEKIYIGNDHMGYTLVGINKDRIKFSGKSEIEIKW